MGAEREREKTDPTSKGGTEPGLGPGSDPNTAPTIEDTLPPPVDFDALHAALGDPLDLDDLPPAAHEVERALETGDSSGRSSATYASARPHTIPPTRAPSEDLNAPAVIVAADALDTVPSAAPKMTIPMRAGLTPPLGPHGMMPNHGSPSSGPHPAANAAFPATPPQGFPAQHGGPQLTVRMPERPINRRPKSPTIVVRPRGPTPRQKLVAFVAMLLLFTACGIAVVIWQRPAWVGLEGPAKSPASAAAPTPAPSPSPSTSHVPSPSPSPSTAGSAAASPAPSPAPPAASASASAKKSPPAKAPASNPSGAPSKSSSQP
ncbi:MAG: hypothetical protein JST00_28045 [Deltaproteobacteria bacterium]|nr:hypothetical protein [Deltaproteobacteria bacterium]